MVYYPATAFNLKSRRYYEALARAGTPHYYASMQPFWDLIRQ
jgi:hypothetical protein